MQPGTFEKDSAASSTRGLSWKPCALAGARRKDAFRSLSQKPLRASENLPFVDCRFLAVETVLYCLETSLLAVRSLRSQRLRMVFTVLDGEQRHRFRQRN
jgi:hypothetical protein